MDTQAFLTKLDRIPDLPSLPHMVAKLNTMLQEHNTSIKEVSRTLETDQAIVSKLLRLVNSTFYGFRSKIRNIPHAIIILGFSNIRNAVVSVSMIKTFSGGKNIQAFDITDFWKHSIAVAVTSRYLAEQSKLDSPDDCFVAGLLHDIGKVVLSQHLSESFVRVWELAEGNGLSFYEAEKQLLPADHAQIGGYLAQKWQFPASLIESITYHHAITRSVSNLTQLIIVHTADTIVNHYQGPGMGDVFSSLDPEAKKLMFRRLESAPAWFPAIEDEIRSACDFFLEQQ